MRVLVLGATGFIGGHIARQALEAGWDVRGLRRTEKSVGTLADQSIEWRAGNLNDPSSLQAAMQGCEVVFHTAGFYPLADYNVPRAVSQAETEMDAVLSAARSAGVTRVIYTSSLTTIGAPPDGSGRLADERDFYVSGTLNNAYFEAKARMEKTALTASGDALEVVALIPTAVFGPGDIKPMTGVMLRDLARGRMPVGVAVETNFVDVRDTALCHIRAVERAKPGDRVIIGGHNMTVGAMLRMAAEASGVKPPPVNLTRRGAIRLVRLLSAFNAPMPALVRGLEQLQPINAEKGWKLFDFQPRPFTETARDAIDWFRDHGYV
jgi:dihydroflavonol-4-reductase